MVVVSASNGRKWGRGETGQEGKGGARGLQIALL